MENYERNTKQNSKDWVSTDKQFYDKISLIDLNVIDTHWMSKPQKRIFNIVKEEKNRCLDYKEIIKLAGYANSYEWHKVLKDIKYRELLEMLGVQTRRRNNKYPPHNEVNYIENCTERELYLENDIWDMRKLFKQYPRHSSPSSFITNFEKTRNPSIRNIIKKYFINMFSDWDPLTYNFAITRMNHFLNPMFELFPNLNSFSYLEREKHIEKILDNMNCSKKTRRQCLFLIKSMFIYMFENKWEEGPNSDTLFLSYDIPQIKRSPPRPILPSVKKTLDDYIIQTIIPLLEDGKATPFTTPSYWDLFIIERFTGRRIEDICHAISESDKKDSDCLRYDKDSDPQLYIDHRIAKIKKDLIIPLAHLNNYTVYGNIVERAILRQKKRVKDLPPVVDGYKYLFREIKVSYAGKGLPKKVLNSKGEEIIDVPSYSRLYDYVLPLICKNIPLQNNDGTIYKITPHMFRHTVATEMIEAGVDIYAIKEFLGHNSIVMTEMYIKIYRKTIRVKYQKNMTETEATNIKNSLPIEENTLYDNKWVRNKLIGIFELGDGCCEHIYKIASCPKMDCKICSKKKIFPRHMQAVKVTIESFTTHRDNAKELGLIKKSEEFNKVVQFYTIALEKISKGEVFEASKDFYNTKILKEW